MFENVKIFIGIILIIISFIYILRKPGVSMMESLIQDRQKKMEKLQAQQEAEATALAQQEAESSADETASEEQ